MHSALKIPEILLDILEHYCPPDQCEEQRLLVIPNLAALARTCRAFKEPALDRLWEDLIDLSPLVRCISSASQQTSKRNMFSFNRLLMSEDWDIIQSYTRRVRSVHHFTRGLDRKAIRTLSTPPTTEPLFPNLRILSYDHAARYAPLLHLPLLSLVSLSVRFNCSHINDNPPAPLPKFCPNIRTLSVRIVPAYKNTLSKMESNHVCRWRNLQSVVCPEFALDADALIHLSRIPALTTLHIGLSNTSLPPNSSLPFSNLHDLTLKSPFLRPVAELLSHIQLPAITNLTICFRDRPSRDHLLSFFSSLGTSAAVRTIETFSLTQSDRSFDFGRRSDPLSLQDLRPCLEFCNLRHMEFGIERDMRLTDADVFMMASAWPQLQHLLINVRYGWGNDAQGGVTPWGLARVLQTCRSLCKIALVMDTRGYTTLAPGHAPERLGLTLPSPFSIDVLDSAIGAEHVDAIAAFFSSITAGSQGSFVAWDGWGMEVPEMGLEWAQLWDNVGVQVMGPTPGDAYPELDHLDLLSN